MPTWNPEGIQEQAQWAYEQRQELRRGDHQIPVRKWGPVVAACCQCGQEADAELMAIMGKSRNCPRRYVDGCDGWLEAR